jgi:hypothetical protein
MIDFASIGFQGIGQYGGMMLERGAGRREGLGRVWVAEVSTTNTRDETALPDWYKAVL